MGIKKEKGEERIKRRELKLRSASGHHLSLVSFGVWAQGTHCIADAGNAPPRAEALIATYIVLVAAGRSETSNAAASIPKPYHDRVQLISQSGDHP